MPKVNLSFPNEFKGELKTERGVFKLGREEGHLKPYDMLLGALGACFFSTFEGIVKKMKVDFDSAEISVSGEHRDTDPTTLKTVDVKFDFKGVDPENDKKIQKALDLAAKYCSIYNTVSEVAEISYEYTI